MDVATIEGGLSTSTRAQVWCLTATGPCRGITRGGKSPTANGIHRRAREGKAVPRPPLQGHNQEGFAKAARPLDCGDFPSTTDEGCRGDTDFSLQDVVASRTEGHVRPNRSTGDVSPQHASWSAMKPPPQHDSTPPTACIQNELLCSCALLRAVCARGMRACL